MDHLIQQIPTILASLLGVWAGFRLGRNSEALDRRRDARIRIRKMACEARGQIAINLFKVYDLRRPEISSLRFDVAEDIPTFMGRRSKFIRLSDRFLSMPETTYKPESDYGGNDARISAWRKMVEDYAQVLDDIADSLQ